MDVREFPVLTEEEGELVDHLSAGLGENAATVLAYLLCRLVEPEFERTATRTAVHIGTGLNRNAVGEALDELSAAGLLTETTVETSTPGRPPKAWHASHSPAEAKGKVYARHAGRLCRQGERVDDALEGGLENEGGGERADEGPDDDPITVALNWETNALHLPLFAARDAERIDRPIELEEGNGSRAAVRAVASGEVDVGVVGAATVLTERARGRPITPVAVLFQRSMAVLYTTESAFGGSFDDLEALTGRRVGMPEDSETGLLGRLLLEQAGVGDDVEVVDVTGEERAALRSGTVDAVTGMFSDPRRLSRAGRSVAVVPVANQYPVYGPTLIATRETLSRRRDALESFLAAVTAGWAETARDPGPTASAVADRTDESAERLEETFRAARDRSKSDAVRKRGWGWHSPERWQRLRTALEQGGVLEP